MFGEIGVLKQVGGKAQCHICGKCFGNLGKHITKTHAVELDDYRAEFGLNRKTGLVGEDTAKRMAQGAWHLESWREKNAEKLQNVSSEMRSARATGVKRRAQYLQSEARQKIFEKTVTANLHTSVPVSKATATRMQKARKKRPDRNCSNCGKAFKLSRKQVVANRDKQYCSKGCYLNSTENIHRTRQVSRDRVLKVKGRPPSKHIRKCPICFSLFRGVRKERKFCSRKCQLVDLHQKK